MRSRFQEEAVLRHREQEESENNHCDLENATKVAKHSEYVINFSYVLNSFLIKKDNLIVNSLRMLFI